MLKASSLFFITATNIDDIWKTSLAQARNQVKIERTWVFLAGGTKGE